MTISVKKDETRWQHDAREHAPHARRIARRRDSLCRSVLPATRHSLWGQHRRRHLVRRRLVLVSSYRLVRDLPPSRRAMRVDPIVAPAPGDLLQELESFWLSHANTSIHSATYDASTPAHGSSRKRAFACAEM